MAKKATEMKVDAHETPVKEAFAKVMSNEKAGKDAAKVAKDANAARAKAKVDSYVTLIVDCLLAGDEEAKVSPAGTIAKPWKNALKKVLVDDGGLKPRVYNDYVANIGNLIMLDREILNNLVKKNPKAENLYGPVALYLHDIDGESEAKIEAYIKRRKDPKDLIEIVAEKIANEYFKFWKEKPSDMSDLEDLVKSNLESSIKAESDRRAKVAETKEKIELLSDLKSKAEKAA